MSAFTDADMNQSTELLSPSLSHFLERRLKIICIDQLNPKPRHFYIYQNEQTILFLWLSLTLVYVTTMLLSFPILSEIYSKNAYFHREFKVEQEKILQQKTEFEQLFDNWNIQRYSNDVSCQQCSSLVSQIDLQQVFRILENQRHIKREYHQTLHPVQSISIFLCLLNNLSIVFIFQRAIRLFLLSNLLLFIYLCIYAEFFIGPLPNVFYTLAIALSIILFTIFSLISSTENIDHHSKLSNNERVADQRYIKQPL